MYCIQCGAENLTRAIYCRKCGALLETEEETRVVRRGADPKPFLESIRQTEQTGNAHGQDQEQDDRETEIFSISPTLLFVKIGYVLAAIAALMLVAVTAAFTSVSSGWAVLTGLLLLLVPAFYHLQKKLIRYKLTDTKLEIDEGLIARRTRNLPLRRIQDVTVSMTMSQRLLGFGDLVVDNASDDGEKIVLQNINQPRRHADVLLRQMKRLER